MKKLGKLSINVDKIMKNEELVNLRGGDYYGSSDSACYFYSDYNYTLICCRITTDYTCPNEPDGTVFTSRNSSAACISYGESYYC